MDKEEFLESYRRTTDLRVQIDPHTAIGGNWDLVGQLQFDYLLRQGLHSEHSLLDIGCGTLRGGQHFIRYLKHACYFGIDISEKTIECAEKLVQDAGLGNKHPTLLVNNDLHFSEFSGRTFDFILAQSVFTHLPDIIIDEGFENLPKLMGSESVFYFTYLEEAEMLPQYRIPKGPSGSPRYWYPFEFFEDMGKKHGFHISRPTTRYEHPYRQTMLEARLA